MITTATRHKAYEDIKPKKKVRYEQILERLNKPMTAKELAIKLFVDGMIPTTERNFTAPRLTELERMGVIEVVGKKRCQYTGKTVAIYRKGNVFSKKEQKMKYKELKGLCKDCLGCNRLEDPNFVGVYQCKYATKEQITVDKYAKTKQLSMEDL